MPRYVPTARRLKTLSDAEIARRYKAGETQMEIAQSIGHIGTTGVANALKRHELAGGEKLGGRMKPSVNGLPPRNAANRRYVGKAQWASHAVDVVERYRAGATLTNIAAHFDCAPGVIGVIIKRFEQRTGEVVLPPAKPRSPAHRYDYRTTDAAPARNSQFAQPPAAISIAGIVPLDEMLRIIARNRDNPAREGIVLEAAKAAAPYIHARLAPIEHTGKLSLEQVIERLTKEQLAEFAASLRSTLAAGEDRGGTEGAGPVAAAGRATGSRLQ